LIPIGLRSSRVELSGAKHCKIAGRFAFGESEGVTAVAEAARVVLLWSEQVKKDYEKTIGCDLEDQISDQIDFLEGLLGVWEEWRKNGSPLKP
jgi:hypothetical protein